MDPSGMWTNKTLNYTRETCKYSVLIIYSMRSLPEVYNLFVNIFWLIAMVFVFYVFSKFKVYIK